MDLAAVLAPICTAVAVCLIWPQVIRVYRLNSVEGLAPLGILHGLAGCTLWTMYGAAKGIVPVIISNAAIGGALFLIAIALVRHRALKATHLVAALVGVAAVGTGSLAVSTTFEGWLAIIVGATSIFPQTVHAARARDLSAVSLPTYGLVCLNTVLWSAYGALIDDPMVILINVVILPCAVLIAFKAWRAQSHPADVRVTFGG
jgi:uncharacterized protein with PQ loop repeat